MSTHDEIVPSGYQRSSAAAALPGTAPSDAGSMGGGTIAPHPAPADEQTLRCCQGMDPSCDGATDCAIRGWAQVDRLRSELAALVDAEHRRKAWLEAHR